MIRAVDKWLPGYIRSVLDRPAAVEGTKHLLFCVADHFEPVHGRTAGEARWFVERWAGRYAEFAGRFRDADNRPPRHTFFYPQEEYDEGCVETLARLCKAGYGEVEIHLHHRNDTGEGFRAKLADFRDMLHQKHGLLGRDRDGRVRYGFVHGNWALCNSRPDGDWCGVNDELTILRETGCYADFTFPSAPSPTQPALVNAIYRAASSKERPRGADRGRRVVRGGAAGDLMLISGPLTLNWRARKWGVLPRVENAEISAVNPPTGQRVELWVRQHISVGGAPDLVFVKVHTHGAVQANADVLFGEAGRVLHEYLGGRYNDGVNWRLHYLTAREMYNVARAVEAGVQADIESSRDYEVGAILFREGLQL